MMIWVTACLSGGFFGVIGFAIGWSLRGGTRVAQADQLWRGIATAKWDVK